MRPERFSMLRSYTVADLLTLANASCGTLSVFLCLQFMDTREVRLMWIAMALLPVALVLDLADGLVARKTGASRIGADLDSLADVVSFGVAPATIAFTLGMRGGWDVVILVYFVVCGISRLARFNVTAAELASPQGKVSHYEGTPIPTSVLLVVMMAVALHLGAVGDAVWFGQSRFGPWLLHPLTLLFAISGSAMISTLRIPKP